MVPACTAFSLREPRTVKARVLLNAVSNDAKWVSLWLGSCTESGKCVSTWLPEVDDSNHSILDNADFWWGCLKVGGGTAVISASSLMEGRWAVVVQVLGYPWLSKACTELSVLVSACLQLLGASLLLSTLQVGYRCEGLWFHFGVGGGCILFCSARGVYLVCISLCCCGTSKLNLHVGI